MYYLNLFMLLFNVVMMAYNLSCLQKAEKNGAVAFHSIASIGHALFALFAMLCVINTQP